MEKEKALEKVSLVKSRRTEDYIQEVFIMTPKEKANEMFNKFYFVQDKDGFHSMSKFRAKECTYIALDEIIGQWEYIDTYLADGNGELNPNLKYWYEVKKEVQKIST